jgi:hypothetical protein
MKWWKKQASRSVRNVPIDEEIPNGKWYRRLEDNWSSPRDGNASYMPDYEKVYRK